MLNERQMSILTYITEHGEAKNTALQSLIGDCSMMTLWRDLTKLEQEGRIIRVRGGAIAAQSPMAGQEANFTCRAKQNVSAKKTLPGLPQIWYIRAMHIIWTRGPQF